MLLCVGWLFFLNIVAKMDITIPLTCVLFLFYFPFIPFEIKKIIYVSRNWPHR